MNNITIKFTIKKMYILSFFEWYKAAKYPVFVRFTRFSLNFGMRQLNP